ncbi:hypothetical protein SDC9_177950 [bioreactor metagenome]|uniref:Uncharacterized protein n=1 Tax=bioreactor metagenome TaxID=1076179 RepID=A0A645GXI7_9ZZZZ
MWVDQGGTVHKESGWRFPPPPPGKSAPQPNLSNEEALKNAMSGILSELNSKLESNPIIKDYKHLTLAAAESSLQITTTANEVYISNTTDGTASILDTRTGVIVRENIRITNTPTRVELPENCDRKGVYTVIFTGDNGKHSICNFYFIQGELEYQNQK